jgi:hypothetical protein
MGNFDLGLKRKRNWRIAEGYAALFQIERNTTKKR